MTLETTSKFDRDYKLIRKRGLPTGELDAAVGILLSGSPLPPRYRDHAISGTYAGCRECHIRSDWLLIYKIVDNRLRLILTRTGTHSDLFGKTRR